MKNLKLIMIFFSFTAMISCNKNEAIVENTTAKQGTKTELIEGVSVIDGVLHFESADKFFEIADKIKIMSDEEFNAIASKTGFKSYRLKLHKEQAERTAKVDEWVKAMELAVDSDYIIEGDDPFKDEFIKPKIESSLYISIISEDGVFFVNGVKHVVDETHVSGYSISKTKSNVTEKLIGSEKYILQSNTKGYTHYTKARFYCEDRSVTAYPKKGYDVVFNEGTPNKRYLFEVHTYAEKHRWGRWRTYNTSHTLAEVRVGNIYCGGINSSNDCVNQHSGFGLPDSAFNNEQEFLKASFYFKFTTRGTVAHGYGVYDSTNLNEDQFDSTPC